MSENEPNTPKLDKVAAAYIKIRDKKKELKKEYETADAALDAQLETLEGFLLVTLKNLGVESVKTQYGTVYQSVNVKAGCENWNSLYPWIVENDAFDILEKRIKKTFVVDYMADNKGELPPGVTVHREYTVIIRRSS